MYYMYTALIHDSLIWGGGRKVYQHNHGQMVKISTMTTAKIQIFHGQNGKNLI